VTRVVVGLGSNLGDRLATLRLAVARVAAVARILATSRVWESAPIGGPPQADYLNAAVLLTWESEPIELLDELARIEEDLGRVRSVPNAPRTIDLDVLWMEGRVSEHPRLVIPHPRLPERAFALAPLLELVPDATDPRTGERYSVPSDQRLRPLDVAL
jgi:2-amino-4-hydroxy-6-hydroxymethyldihydropteridine diphosphokinase